MERIYLDYNATSPLHPLVRAEMARVGAELLGNASARHSFGRRARGLIDDAREQLAALFGVQADEIYFTSGGTESNNLIISSCGCDGPIAISAVEHASILEPFRRILKTRARNCGTTQTLRVDALGRVVESPFGGMPPSVDGAGEAKGLVSLQWVNSETGVIQDLAAVGVDLKSRGTLFHTDGAQGFFRLPTRIPELGVDAATITSHKSFGPQGVGALFVRRGIVLDPMLVGGPQERRVRPGTENVLAIHGMGALAKLARTEELWPQDELRAKRLAFWSALEPISQMTRVSPEAESFPGVLAVALPDLLAEMVLFRLDQLGVAASSGSACAAGGQEPSHVLKAMGLPEELQRGALRFSFGPAITVAQLREAAARTAQVVRDLRRDRASTR